MTIPKAVALALVPPNRQVQPFDVNQLIWALLGQTDTQMVPQPWTGIQAASGSLSLTGSWQDVPGATLTLSTEGLYLIECEWELTATDGYAVGQLVVAGTAVANPAGAGLSATVSASASASSSATSTLTGGSPGESVSTSVTTTVTPTVSVTVNSVVGQRYLYVAQTAGEVAKLQAKRTTASSGACGTQSSITAVRLGVV